MMEYVSKRPESTEPGLREQFKKKMDSLARVGILFGVLFPNTVHSEFMFQDTPVSMDIALSVGVDPLLQMEQVPVKIPGEVSPANIELTDPREARTVEAVTKLMPPSFLKNVVAVRREAATKMMPKAYGMSEQNEAAHVEQQERAVVFTEGSRNHHPALFGYVMLHETCHLNDPEMNQFMTVADRQRMYHQIIQRTQAADRHRSAYVESIANENAKAELRMKAKEYWAEICSAYLSGDAALPIPDANLVSGMLEKTDPGIRIGDARKEVIDALIVLDGEWNQVHSVAP